MQAAAQSNEVESLVAAAQAESAQLVEELRTQLDVAVLEKQRTIDEFEAYRADIEQREAAIAAEKEFAAKRDERLGQVREVAAFPDTYLTDNAERWARMSDEDFAAALGEYQTLSGGRKVESSIPKRTALVASREIDSHSGPAGRELYRQVMRGRLVDADRAPLTS
jgi:hypothetical protein